MPRILYSLLTAGGVRGGHKMTVRHVEGLRELGFDAYLYLTAADNAPTWIEHSAPIVVGGVIRPDDIIVLPEDSAGPLAQMSRRQETTVIFYQGGHSTAQMAAIDAFPDDRFPTILSVGRRQRADIARLYPKARVEFVPCFADERWFKPSALKADRIVYAVNKRPNGAAAISSLFARLYPEHADVPWAPLSGMPEAGVAALMGASTIFLCLGLMESVGLMPLEAMASGCVCVGFKAVGGEEFATPQNGFWVPDDDYIGAADALASAVSLVSTGGDALQAMRNAGFQTAEQWSRAVFLAALEQAWMRIAPQARTLGG